MISQSMIPEIMKDIRKTISLKYGGIPLAMEPMIQFYEDSLMRYSDFMEAYEAGNHNGVLLRQIQDTVTQCMTIGGKLGITNPVDLARLKKLETSVKEPGNEEEKDYLDTL